MKNPLHPKVTAPQEANAFNDPSYQRSRKKALEIIPKTSFFESIDKYAGSVATGLFMMAFGAIVAPGSSALLIGALIAGAVVSAGVGMYAHYQTSKIFAPVSLERQEQHSIAVSKMHGHHLAEALQAGGAETEIPISKDRAEPSPRENKTQSVASVPQKNWGHTIQQAQRLSEQNQTITLQ